MMKSRRRRKGKWARSVHRREEERESERERERERTNLHRALLRKDDTERLHR
jgi:hypothetical protein